MANAILVHGKPDREEYFDPNQPSASNAHWFPWLQNQLLTRGIHTATPEVPDCWRPRYPFWRREFERYDLTPETLLVGHSCGGGFLVRWLSEHPQVQVAKLVLVAPWLDPDRSDTTDFFDFTIEAQLASRVGGVRIFASDNDAQTIHRSVDQICAAIPEASVRVFGGYGHFCLGDLGTEQFPELLAELVGEDPGSS